VAFAPALFLLLNSCCWIPGTIVNSQQVAAEPLSKVCPTQNCPLKPNHPVPPPCAHHHHPHQQQHVTL